MWCSASKGRGGGEGGGTTASYDMFLIFFSLFFFGFLYVGGGGLFPALFEKKCAVTFFLSPRASRVCVPERTGRFFACWLVFFPQEGALGGGGKICIKIFGD